MFVSERGGLRELETINLAPGEQLVNLCAPHVVSLLFSALSKEKKILSGCKCPPISHINLSPFSLLFFRGFRQITLKINNIGRIALRDFKGLEKCDPSTRKMVLDFSLNVAQGNMDHAFRFICFDFLTYTFRFFCCLSFTPTARSKSCAPGAIFYALIRTNVEYSLG